MIRVKKRACIFNKKTSTNNLLSQPRHDVYSHITKNNEQFL
jgi:hypothetical protein